MSAQRQRSQHVAAGTPPGIQQLVLEAELQANSVQEALTHYEAALEQLNRHIRTLPSRSPAQNEQIDHFKQLLTTAEQLKQAQQSDPAAAEYTWRKNQAKHLAEQVRSAPWVSTAPQHDEHLQRVCCCHSTREDQCCASICLCACTGCGG